MLRMSLDVIPSGGLSIYFLPQLLEKSRGCGFLMLENNSNQKEKLVYI